MISNTISNRTNKGLGNPLEQLQITSNLLTKYTDQAIEAEIGISQAQLTVLSAIDSCNSPVNESRISEKIHRNMTSLSIMLNRLVKSGLVKKTRSNQDYREYYLTLTPQGKEKATRGEIINRALNKQLITSLSDVEIDELKMILNKLQNQVINKKG